MDKNAIKIGENGYVVKRRCPDEFKKLILEDLNKHFSASSLEKYDDATVSWLFKEGAKKYCGNGRISERQKNRIQKYMIKWLRSHYGRYMNVMRRKDRYFFNFSQAFKTKMGRLYNIRYPANILITSHALDRFEERVNIDEYKSDWRSAFKKRYHTEPTILDFADYLMSFVEEYAVPFSESSIYFNVGLGIFVADWYNTFGLIKTFLLPGMKIPEAQWYYSSYLDFIDEESIEDSDEINGPTLSDGLCS